MQKESCIIIFVYEKLDISLYQQKGNKVTHIKKLRIMKAILSQFPTEIQEEIKSILTCFDSVNISFSNKKFRVSTGLGISSEYPEDFKYYGEIKNSDIYTREEMALNLKNM